MENSVGSPKLPEEYVEHYRRHAAAITGRLGEFRAVPREELLMELCYCLLTPQSRAAHAEIVMARLREQGFPRSGVDPTPYLRDPANYIRFHNQKGKRLMDVAAREREIVDVVGSPELTSAEKREWLVRSVNGLGWKEASHYLRNVGHFDLAIIDRHVLKHMLRCGAIGELPKSVGTRRAYLELEERFRALAVSAGLTLQELDLLFWSFEEGSVRK
jgi:N-glycosylase/DNA lyase